MTPSNRLCAQLRSYLNTRVWASSSLLIEIHDAYRTDPINTKEPLLSTATIYYPRCALLVLKFRSQSQITIYYGRDAQAHGFEGGRRRVLDPKVSTDHPGRGRARRRLARELEWVL
ncbi:hypothetical protein BC937DRAFT_86497 [Endogone sp. FLAS-F59071]|nr:hypothetical protein BC937DRAFT_86729 [Endogone sp. FLAS-F59071]RUS20047.1 hypothetical protein BC937DRAFT_86497 [Endogone sp. FLAS-F59071]|eukprot:RUS19905.1 hypothetical protein BC937DRAFT_86729 [Endogone sp. FLAS-F59071]